MGRKLGTNFARAGHEVVCSYARSDQTLKRLARNAGLPRMKRCLYNIPGGQP